MDNTEDTDLEEKVLTIQQRQKRAQIMRRYKSKIERSREIAQKRMAPESNIRKRAFVQARQLIRRRVAGERGAEYEKLGPSEKIAIDRAVEGKQQLIKKLALRLIPRIKQAESKRLASYMKGQSIENQGQPEGKSKESSGSSSVKEDLNTLFTEAFPPYDTSTALGQKAELPIATSEKRINNKKNRSNGDTIQQYGKFQEEVENNTTAFAALCKKSDKSGIDLEILGEVYSRGWDAWSEDTNITQQQYAFARVNSYINQGRTYFNEDSDLHEMKTVTNRSHAKMLEIKVGGKAHSYKKYGWGLHHPTYGPLKDEKFNSKAEMKAAMEKHPRYNPKLSEEAELEENAWNQLGQKKPVGNTLPAPAKGSVPKHGRKFSEGDHVVPHTGPYAGQVHRVTSSRAGSVNIVRPNTPKYDSITVRAKHEHLSPATPEQAAKYKAERAAEHKRMFGEGRAPGTPSIKRYTRNDGTTALKSLNKWGKRKDWRDTEGGLAKAREHAGVDKITEARPVNNPEYEKSEKAWDYMRKSWEKEQAAKKKSQASEAFSNWTFSMKPGDKTKVLHGDHKGTRGTVVSKHEGGAVYKIRHNDGTVMKHHISTLSEPIREEVESIDEENSEYQLKKVGTKQTMAHPEGKATYELHHNGKRVGTISPYSGTQDKKKPGSRIVTSRKDVTKYSINFDKDQGPQGWHKGYSTYQFMEFRSPKEAHQRAINLHTRWRNENVKEEVESIDEAQTQNKRSVVNRGPQFKSAPSTKAKTKIQKNDYVIHPKTGKTSRVIDTDPKTKTATIRSIGGDESSHSWSDLKHYSAYDAMKKNDATKNEEVQHTNENFSEHVDIGEDLRQWFKDKWVRMDTKGKIKGDCAREEGEGKPKCLPLTKARAMDKKDRALAARRKRREDPVADRVGKGSKPINVRTEEYIEEKNSPSNPALWSRAKSLAKQKFDVYPSAYANGWAAKWYKARGGKWNVSESDLEEAYDVNSKHYKALTDLDLNTKNRDMTSKHDGYGPLNPKDEKGSKSFWEEKAKTWNTTVDAAKEARCRNCAAFNQAPAIMKKMAEGLGPAGEKIQDLANLGFCELFEFKCAGDRTCNKWLVNGPITEQESVNTKARKKIEVVDRKPPHTEYTRQAELKNKVIDEEHSNCGTPECCGQCDTAVSEKLGNVQNNPSKRLIGTKSLVKAYKADTPGENKNLNEAFNIAFAAGVGVTLTAKDLGMVMKGGFEYHPSVVEAMDEMEEEVRSADVRGEVVPAHTRVTVDPKTGALKQETVPATVRRAKANKKIIRSGDVHDGEPNA